MGPMKWKTYCIPRATSDPPTLKLLVLIKPQSNIHGHTVAGVAEVVFGKQMSYCFEFNQGYQTKLLSNAIHEQIDAEMIQDAHG